ncbi:MAG TPA: phosphoglucosamine mutase [Acidimicrobiia bacterium]|nr:phosphoglucosamine mutase [Acidimicrobiia bacterium]
MNTRPQFGTDGVRGTFDESLTPEFVYLLGLAIAQVMSNVEFVVGRDTRMSGPVLRDALISGLLSGGAHATDIGIITTPGIASNAYVNNVAACAITASHNPASDNGIKVFGVGGVKIDSQIEAAIERTVTHLIEAGQPVEIMPVAEVGEQATTAYKTYKEFLINKTDGSDLSGLRIVLDCANGASFLMAPEIFSQYGAEVIAINTESDGMHINERCGATHLESICESVVSNNADIGFAFDGDADRVMVVDNRGVVRNGDYILALFAIYLKNQSLLKNDLVVATAMSNGGLGSFLKTNSIELLETPVGDKYVLAEMIESEATLGGEQSGHIIRADKTMWGDGILNALLVSSIFAERYRTEPAVTSFELFDLFTPMVQLHDQIKVIHKESAQDNQEILHAIEQERALLGQESRIIIRPSGTEDVVRITVEGLIEKAAQESMDRLTKVISKVCG